MPRLSMNQLGLCSWSTHAKNPAELAQRCQDCGLTAVQLALNPVASESAVWGKTQEVLAKQGIRVVSGMFGTVGEDYSTLETIKRTGGVVPDQHWEENWKIVQATAKVAAGMGLKLVSMHAGFLPHEESDPSFAKLIGRIIKMAEEYRRYGITLLFETGQETATTLRAFLEALDKAGATNTGVNFDPANMILYDKGDPIEALKVLLPRVKQTHIKDAVRTKTPGQWGAEVAIGDGQVNWRAFIDTLAGGSFTGNLIIEREAGPDRVGDIRKAIAHLKPMLA